MTKIKKTDIDTTNAAGGTDNFLRADGSWQVPPGEGVEVSDPDTDFGGMTKIIFGDNLTVTDNTDGSATVDVNTPTIDIKEEGTSVVAAAVSINFVGSTVTVTDGGGGVAVVTISGGGGSGSIEVDDEGSSVVGSATILNFTGAGVTVTDGGSGEAVINIPGGGGGGSYASARYWRIRGIRALNSHHGDGLGFCLVDFLDGSGTSLVGSGTPSASREEGGWPATEAFNGSSASNNGWYSGNGDGAMDFQQWLQYDFGSAVTVRTVKFACLTGYSWSVGQILAIDYSTDEITWVETQMVNPGIASDGVQKSVSVLPAA